MAKILLATHIYPPAVDGGSKIVYKIGQHLSRQGHQIMVLTSNASSTDDFTRHFNPVNNQGLAVYTIFHKPLKLFSRILSKGPIFKIMPFIIFLKSCIRFHPDYIIAGPLPTTIIPYATIIKQITGAKLIIIPCYHPEDPDFKSYLIRKSLNSSDMIIAFTKIEKDLLSKHCSQPIIVSPPGVDKSFLINPNKIIFPKKPNILFIANFAVHKRFELLLDAFILLQKKYPDLSLTALGQKTLYWPKIQDKLNQSTPKIKLIFNPTQKQIKQAINRTTLLCLPSVHESFGLVFAESLARGKPVIGADTPQTSEVIKLLLGGITFKTDNIFDLTSKISFMLDHPRKTQQLGKRGYNFIKKQLTWDTIVTELWQKIQ